MWKVNERREQVFDILSQPEILTGCEGLSTGSPVMDVDVADGTVRYVIRQIERLSEIEVKRVWPYGVGGFIT